MAQRPVPHVHQQRNSCRGLVRDGDVLCETIVFRFSSSGKMPKARFSTPTRTCVFFVMNKFLSLFRHFLLRVRTSEKLVNVGAETKCSSGEVSGILSGKD